MISSRLLDDHTTTLFDASHGRDVTRRLCQIIRNAARAVLVLALVLLSRSPAYCWTVVLDTPEDASLTAIAVDNVGDVIAAGELPGPSGSTRLGVVKFRRADGVELWRSVIDDAWFGVANVNGMRLDAAGNAVVVVGDNTVLDVMKFASTNGLLVFRKQFPAEAWNRAVTVDGAGNVLAGSTILFKLSNNGDEIWQVGPICIPSSHCSLTVLEADGVGDIYGAGSGIVGKIGSDGAGLWMSIDFVNRVDYEDLAIDTAGDVFAVGSATLAKFAGNASQSVAPLWRRDIVADPNTGGCAGISRVAIDSNGDLIVAGTLCSITARLGGAAVWKFDDAGTELWRRTLEPGQFADLALDSEDNVIVSGYVAQNCEPGGVNCDGARFSVVKLSADGNTELWRTSFGETYDYALVTAVAVDHDDNVAAAGRFQIDISDDYSFNGSVVQKVFGTDGQSYEARCGDGRVDAGEQCDDGNTVDGDGCSSVCVDTAAPESNTGPATPGIPVKTDVEENGATPADPIETSVTSPDTSGTESITIQEGPLSSIGSAQYQFLGQEVSITAPPASADDPLVLVFRIDASRVPDGENETTLEVFKNGVAVEDCANVLGIANPDPCVWARATLSDGDIELTVLTTTASYWNIGARVAAQPVAGAALIIVDKPGDPSKRKIALKIVDQYLAMGTPGSGNDPTCVGGGGGALLEVFGILFSDRAAFELPCAYWSVLGSPGKEKGYKYVDKQGVAGPVTVALIKNRKGVKVVAKGSQIGFSLDEPFQSAIGVALRSGLASGYCTFFGEPTIVKDEPGRFIAKRAAAPAVCP